MKPIRWQSGDPKEYGDRRGSDRRYQHGGKERRSGKDRRKSYPGEGRGARRDFISRGSR